MDAIVTMPVSGRAGVGHTVSGNTVIGHIRNIDTMTATAEALAQKPNVRLVVEAQDIDTSSNRVQISVRIENIGPHRLRILSLRALAPLGTEIQQVIDATQSQIQLARDDLYDDLSKLLSSHLIKVSADYRRKLTEMMRDALIRVISTKGLVNLYYRVFLTRPAARLFQSGMGDLRAWSIRIRSSSGAQKHYDEFLKPHEDESKELCQIYRAKLEDVRQIENELGNDDRDDGISDVDPGGVFSRTYIYNCERSPWNPKVYTFSFDCGYLDHGVPGEPKHLGASIASVISPNPVGMNVLAIASAILGAGLKIALDSWQGRDDLIKISMPPGLPPQMDSLLTSPIYGAVAAGVLTSLLFYNIFNSTNVGKRVNFRRGWRGALLVGVLSGLLNQRVIAVLVSLLG
jgi:hypothetical protein